MFQKYTMKVFFCGYEYHWRCTDWDNNEFTIVTKDSPIVYPDHWGWHDAKYDGHNFMKDYVQDGSKKIKIKQAQCIKKVPFKEYIKEDRRIKLFGKAKDGERMIGPSEDHFKRDPCPFIT